jgi:hypothetical protein
MVTNSRAIDRHIEIPTERRGIARRTLHEQETSSRAHHAGDEPDEAAEPDDERIPDLCVAPGHSR